uniref:Uncharacterized protein n=1 Tax=Arundo donax TaxID=35708 RepID=A0A0A9FWF1_ARUDO
MRRPSRLYKHCRPMIRNSDMRHRQSLELLSTTSCLETAMVTGCLLQEFHLCNLLLTGKYSPQDYHSPGGKIPGNSPCKIRTKEIGIQSLQDTTCKGANVSFSKQWGLKIVVHLAFRNPNGLRTLRKQSCSNSQSSSTNLCTTKSCKKCGSLAGTAAYTNGSIE